MSYLQTAVELFAGMVLLFTLMKVLGKTQMSQITPFEFISALIVGELIGNAIYDKDIKLQHIIFSVLVWGILLYIVEKIEMKSIRARAFLEGNPSIVVRQGWIDRQELKKNNLDLNQLQSLLRQKEVFSLRDVEYAIMEPNGTLTVLKNFAASSALRTDVGAPEQPASQLPVTLISDGIILHNNLKMCGFDQNWLYKQLDKQGYTEHKESQILIAEWDPAQGLYIVPMAKPRGLEMPAN